MSGKTPLVEDLSYISFEDAATPRDGLAMIDRWWIVHPDKGLAVWKGFSPQCNRRPEIGESLLKHYPGHEVRFIPVAYTGTVGQ